MKAVVAAFNQEKALVGAFSVITNLRMELFEALVDTLSSYSTPCDLLVTRAATEAELVELLVARLRRMLRAGTTTVECKVGLVTVFLQTF